MIQTLPNTIVLRPNRSASWRTNLHVLLVMTCIVGSIAIGFSLLGAWVILPFAGLELMALGSALYWVNWKLSYCHALRIENSTFIIEKGVYYPRQRWNWPVEDTSMRVQRKSQPNQAPEIHVQYQQESVAIGEFLDIEESESLIAGLRGMGIRVSADSGKTSITL